MIAAPPSPEERLASGLATEQTRRHARNLQLVAVLAIVVVILDLVPTRISALGIEFGETDQHKFLWLLVAFDLAYLVSFCVYASTDLARGLSILGQSSQEIQTLEEHAHNREQMICDLVNELGRTSDQEKRKLAADVVAQANKLSVVLQKRRLLALLRRTGWSRVLLDFGIPFALSLVAIALLLLRIY